MRQLQDGQKRAENPFTAVWEGILIGGQGRNRETICSLLSIWFDYRGTSPIRKRPPPKDPPTTLGIGLR